MIDDEEYSSFKFEGDEEADSEPTLYQEDDKDRRVEKLGQRVTIISILIPVLIGAVFYIAYRDITSRVSQTQDAGELEIQSLSSQLEENFAALSAKYADLETALTEKLADLEKVDKAMKANLQQAEATVQKINATKADKEDQQEVITKIEEALKPIRKELQGLAAVHNDLKAVTAEIAALDKGVKQQFSDLSQKVDKAVRGVTKTQSELASLSERKLDKDTMQLELLKARKNFQRDLDVARSAIDQRLDAMLRKIRDLEKLTQAPLASPRPSADPASQGPGSIVEQDIKE